MERAAHRDQDVGVGPAHDLQIAGDGSRRHEEDAVREVFGGEQCPLTEGLLAEVKEPCLAEASWTMLVDQAIVDLAPVQSQTDGLFLTVNHRLAGWFVSGDSDERDLAWRSLRALGAEEWKVDLFDDIENGLGLEGRAVQPLLNLGGKSGIEGLGIQPLEHLAVPIANAHR
jgi:hypothetical protein